MAMDKIELQSLLKLYEHEIAKMEDYCKSYMPLTADYRKANDELDCLRKFYHKLVKKLGDNYDETKSYKKTT